MSINTKLGGQNRIVVEKAPDAKVSATGKGYNYYVKQGTMFVGIASTKVMRRDKKHFSIFSMVYNVDPNGAVYKHRHEYSLSLINYFQQTPDCFIQAIKGYQAENKKTSIDYFRNPWRFR